jgi:poly(3-hydroxybutyrate) depolymerase
MTSRRLCAMVCAFGVIVGACAGQDPQTSTGSGGSSGTGGTSGQGGTPGSAGMGGAAGTTGAGGTSSTGGQSGTTGSAGAGGSSGTTGAAGAGAGGSSGTMGTAGAGAGGASGGASGTTGTAGTGAAGSAGMMGTAGTGGAGGAAGRGGGGGSASGGSGGSSGTGGAIPLKNPPVPSAGCGKSTTVTTGKKTITSTGQQRTYIIDIPANYDMNKPYRLFYASHWIGSTSEAVRDQNYYFLKPLATAANDPAIFVAPQSDGSTWQQKDHALFDDILAYVKQNLCIDTTRVFATGFSFGGMITYSLSVNHQKDIRAAVGIAPANYNIYLPAKTRQPIAWMQTTGLSDGTCPWVNGTSTTQGAKYIAIEKATDNGCAVPATIPTWQSGNHLCYDLPGCRAEFPTKVCTFNGGHTNIANDPGSTTNWIPTESWRFFTQF